MEELLTKAEIAEVLQEAGKPEYKEAYLFNFTSRKLDIFKVSTKGLIFIKGDDHTGMDHIGVRHSITSRKLFEKDGVFDNPTKFNIAPVEYAFVADAIYIPENLNNDKNKRPDLFDCYIGDFSHKDGKIFRYTLILYKSTTIVHTFFLSSGSKPYNKKVKLPIRQGWCSSKHNLMTGLQEYSINYSDKNDVIRFTVYLRSIPMLKLERWYLTVNNEQGAPVFTHFLAEEMLPEVSDPDMRIGILDFQDLSSIDKKIKDIINGSYEFERSFDQYCNYRYNQ